MADPGWRTLWLRPPAGLLRRIDHAAVAARLDRTRYVTRVLEQGLTRPLGEPVGRSEERISVSIRERLHLRLREAATKPGITANQVALRILERDVPHVVELLAEAATEPS
jgi:hypothetical protein